MSQADLIPFNKLTKEEQKKLASKGGKKSVKVKKEKKQVREIIEAIFNSKAPKDLINKLGAQFPDVEIKTIEDLINASMMRQTLKGNVQAYNALYDRKEGKPKQPITGGEEGDKPVAISILQNIKNVPSNDSDKENNKP